MKRCPDCQSTYPDEVNHCFVDGQRLVVETVETDRLVGALLDGRFRLEARVGQGGMGSVYRGVQEPVGRPVAVKVLRRELASDKQAVQRFFHEAKVVSKLRHPNTVTLFDFGQADSGELFIAMEHLAGHRLDQRMAEDPLSLGELIDVIDQVCQSLVEAHETGVIHRDLKPDNVFVDRVSDRNLVKVLDFGIAKVPDGPRLTRTGMVFGTPAFMSPEQAQGFDLDARSDLYTLGVMLYWLLSARLPFQGDGPMQIALRHVTERPVPIVEVSRYSPLPISLETLVMELLEKLPERRPQSAAEVRRRLRAVERELASTATDAQEADKPDTLKEPWSVGGPAREEPHGTELPGPSRAVEPIDAPTGALRRSFWKTSSGRLFLVAGLIVVLAGAIAVMRDLADPSAEGVPVAELAELAGAEVEQPEPSAAPEETDDVFAWIANRDSAAVRVASALRTAETFASRVAEQANERQAQIDQPQRTREPARQVEPEPEPEPSADLEPSAEPEPSLEPEIAEAVQSEATSLTGTAGVEETVPDSAPSEQPFEEVEDESGGLMAPILVR